ncbi:DUF4194 domain-containing protein [Dietzia maris]|jgi:hypothetical protein|uniref:DUF4194 domain-containing protein n=1 Tax=Dietzia TaxID=37914 RepID=UPI0022B531B4|nr:MULTISPECIES: DUF4194 domain-containing protein [Dietzia]MCZ4539770.1 DUF4194 domain-containing protein [Dietzia maris]MCZ4656751.1 DUF4194 domain-containing protein [Dietzia kunjamensis]MDV3355762.1 DUF4194 domain-containing protein [Dietzia sp. IN118]
MTPDVGGSDVPPDIEQAEQGLWPGDTGTLSFASRRALARLLTGPLVHAHRQPEIWAAVISDEPALRSRLADVFLDLVLDHDAGIAFTRQVDTGGRVEVPAVLRTETLSHMDTVLLLHLRSELSVAQPGERVIVDREDVAEQIDVYRSVIDSDRTRYTRKFDASWNRLKSYSLLSDTETENRAEVSPVLRHLFDADVVAGIREEYRALIEARDGSDDQDETLFDDDEGINDD